MSEQNALFEDAPSWTHLWKGMPEYIQEDQEPFDQINVAFRTEEDRLAFARLLGQSPNCWMKRIWYPEPEPIKSYAGKSYKSQSPVNPRYPVYVPTKGRWDSAFTIKALEKIGVPYFAVIQPQEFEQYRTVVKTGEILLLPPGLDGLVPARNWIRQHAESSGAARHWQIDDNISGFFRLNKNLKTPVGDGTVFRAMEDFSDRYENVAVSGPNYFMFAKNRDEIPPIVLNTRVYSCSLINHAMPYYWRDVFNDDTDLCLRALKTGWCVVLFNAFLCYKQTTMTIKGGNTDLYQGDGRRQMAESLIRQHPDVTTLSYKFGHWQHHVDYSSFRKNKLIPKPGVSIPEGEDNYGMILEVER